MYNIFKRSIIDSEVVRDFIKDDETHVYSNVSPQTIVTLSDIVFKYGNKVPNSVDLAHDLTYNDDPNNPFIKKGLDLADLQGFQELESQNAKSIEEIKRLKQLKEKVAKKLIDDKQVPPNQEPQK